MEAVKVQVEEEDPSDNGQPLSDPLQDSVNDAVSSSVALCQYTDSESSEYTSTHLSQPGSSISTSVQVKQGTFDQLYRSVDRSEIQNGQERRNIVTNEQELDLSIVKTEIDDTGFNEERKECENANQTSQENELIDIKTEIESAYQTSQQNDGLVDIKTEIEVDLSAIRSKWEDSESNEEGEICDDMEENAPVDSEEDGEVKSDDEMEQVQNGGEKDVSKVVKVEVVEDENEQQHDEIHNESESDEEEDSDEEVDHHHKFRGSFSMGWFLKSFLSNEFDRRCRRAKAREEKRRRKEQAKQADEDHAKELDRTTNLSKHIISFKDFMTPSSTITPQQSVSEIERFRAQVKKEPTVDDDRHSLDFIMHFKRDRRDFNNDRRDQRDDREQRRGHLNRSSRYDLSRHSVDSKERKKRSKSKKKKKGRGDSGASDDELDSDKIRQRMERSRHAVMKVRSQWRRQRRSQDEEIEHDERGRRSISMSDSSDIEFVSTQNIPTSPMAKKRKHYQSDYSLSETSLVEHDRNHHHRSHSRYDNVSDDDETHRHKRKRSSPRRKSRKEKKRKRRKEESNDDIQIIRGDEPESHAQREWHSDSEERDHIKREQNYDSENDSVEFVQGTFIKKEPYFLKLERHHDSGDDSNQGERCQGEIKQETGECRLSSNPESESLIKVEELNGGQVEDNHEDDAQTIHRLLSRLSELQQQESLLGLKSGQNKENSTHLNLMSHVIPKPEPDSPPPPPPPSTTYQLQQPAHNAIANNIKQEVHPNQSSDTTMSQPYRDHQPSSIYASTHFHSSHSYHNPDQPSSNFSFPQPHSAQQSFYHQQPQVPHQNHTPQHLSYNRALSSQPLNPQPLYSVKNSAPHSHPISLNAAQPAVNPTSHINMSSTQTSQIPSTIYSGSNQYAQSSYDLKSIPSKPKPKSNSPPSSSYVMKGYTKQLLDVSETKSRKVVRASNSSSSTKTSVSGVPYHSSPAIRGVATSDRVDSNIMQDEVKKGFKQLVMDAVRSSLEHAWSTSKVNKEQYKDIFKKCVEKICGSNETVVKPDKIKTLVHAYITKTLKLAKAAAEKT